MKPILQQPLPGFEASATTTPVATSRATWPGPAGQTRYTLFLALFPALEDARRCAEAGRALRERHALEGRVLAAERLHLTLQVIVKNTEAACAAALVHTVRDATDGVCRWAPVPLTFDHALSFDHSQAFVLRCDARSDAAVARLRDALGLALRAAGLRASASTTPHMTLLYSARSVGRQPIAPLCWTASRLVLVLSHVACTHHEWLAEWPLRGTC